MSPFRVGDAVSHVKKPHRGVATIKELVDGLAKLHYPQFNLTVVGVRVRDLKREEA